jgi:hypothetical protein
LETNLKKTWMCKSTDEENILQSEKIEFFVKILIFTQPWQGNLGFFAKNNICFFPKLDLAKSSTFLRPLAHP